MTKQSFWQVDAFAQGPFTGNPAAVIVLDHWLADDMLQAIAAENNLAETAFVVPGGGDEADYELRWFTPTVEVVLCGHATLASGHVLLGARDALRFRTRHSGVLTVLRAPDGALAVDLPALPAQPRPLPDLAAAMGGPVQATLWREGGYGLFVYPDEAAIRALKPDFRALATMGGVLQIATAPGAGADIVSRVFAPGAGIDEDPVTGSAHCVLMPYWAERLGRDRISAYQASARGGHLDCALAGNRVFLTGRCVTVIEGLFVL